MTRSRFVAVVDESGTTNRPRDEDDHDFGVGALILPCDLIASCASAANTIAASLKKKDYKYKDVQGNCDARSRFLGLLNMEKRPIRTYAFYASHRSIANEKRRVTEAMEHYTDSSMLAPDSDELHHKSLLESFIEFMAPQLAAHAFTNGYHVDVYWDRRTDINVIHEVWDRIVPSISKNPIYRGMSKSISFAGEATRELSAISRLAGVVAGDVRCFFNRHGYRVWQHFDQGGLVRDEDPYMNWMRQVPYGAPLVATVNELLADSDPETSSSEACMLQGYYRSLLENDETGHHLISFGDPNGRLGIIAIEHGSRWHVHQLPD